MSRIVDILNGVKNYAAPGEASEELAEQRAKICQGCPSMKFIKNLELIKDGKLEQIQGHICQECGCVLSFKLRSEEATCPLKKW